MLRPWSALLGIAATVVAAFLLVYAVVLHSWKQSWGATEAEIHGTLPGDDLIAATGQVTHAVTINPRPKKIWRWLIEVGQDRSGLYSYTFWEPAHFVMEREVLQTIKRLSETDLITKEANRNAQSGLVISDPPVAYEYSTFRSPLTIRPTL